MPPDFFESRDWNNLWYPLINLVCIGTLLWNMVIHARERDEWRREAKRLQALLEQLTKERNA
jgi:hypothetical protein